jgi:hypothetical protein
MKNFPDWNQEFTDYLLKNGLKQKANLEKENGAMYFSTLINGIMVYPSGRIVFYEWTESNNEKKEDWAKVFEFIGYDLLTTVEFKLLCHITGLVPIKGLTEITSKNQEQLIPNTTENYYNKKAIKKINKSLSLYNNGPYIQKILKRSNPTNINKISKGIFGKKDRSRKGL